MKVGFLILIFYSVMAFSSEWQMVRSDQRFKTWKIPGSEKIISQFTIDAPYKVNKGDIKGHFKKIETDKRKMLSEFGITNWKAKNYRLIKAGKQDSVSFAGSYTDKNKKVFRFTEVHVYYPQKTVQLLYVEPEKGKETKNVEKLLLEKFL